MEIKQFIQKKKEIYSSIMDFIGTTENANIDTLISDLEQHEILKDKKEILSTLQLLSKISDNHHRLPDFISKLSKIIQYLLQTIRPEISDYEIYQIFENNKRILLLLLEEKFIQPDEQIISDIKKTKDKNNFPYSHYLYSEIKSFLNEKEIKKIENEIKQKYDEEIMNFVEKCRIGENDSYICSLIRQDSAEEFISYVNRTNTSLSSRIQPSIFETNSFLMQKTPTLIEYASFFGSIQIIQYLKYSNVSLTYSMWFYVIHSNNAELIHFLEEIEIKPERNSQIKRTYFYNTIFFKTKENIAYEKIYVESILCHHNSIADYIKNNFLDQNQTTSFESMIIYSCNYYYFPADLESIGKIISRPKNTYGFCVSQLCHSLTQITIPSSVTKIGNDAFSGCSSLTQITIPSSVTSIEEEAFCGCSSLTHITISSSVTSIGDSTFSGCSSLTQIIIPSSVITIGQSVFNGMKSLIIKGDLQKITHNMFEKCSSLAQITIPSSVTSIGEYAFSECSSLTQITIPSSVTSIGEHAFSGVKSLTITGDIQKLFDKMFNKCSTLAQITIPSSVTSIGVNVFEGCSSLTQITIPSSVTSIGNSAFSGCSSLTQITIPSSVTSIGNSAFFKCSSLTQITIPSSVTYIGNYAFNNNMQIKWLKNKNISEFWHQNNSNITNEFEIIKNSAIQMYLKYKIYQTMMKNF